MSQFSIFPQKQFSVGVYILDQGLGAQFFIEIAPDTKISSTKSIKEGILMFHNRRLLCIFTIGYINDMDCFVHFFLSHLYCKGN